VISRGAKALADLLQGDPEDEDVVRHPMIDRVEGDVREERARQVPDRQPLGPPGRSEQVIARERRQESLSGRIRT